jgi:hypothetical protein
VLLWGTFVLGGALVQCSPVVLEAAARIVRLRVLPIVSQPRALAPSALGSDAALDWLFAAPSGRLLGHVAAYGNGRVLVASGRED